MFGLGGRRSGVTAASNRLHSLPAALSLVSRAIEHLSIGVHGFLIWMASGLGPVDAEEELKGAGVQEEMVWVINTDPNGRETRRLMPKTVAMEALMMAQANEKEIINVWDRRLSDPSGGGYWAACIGQPRSDHENQEG